jgi:putative oxidoreductase
MLERLLKTERDGTLTLIRVALGTMILAHGAQKLLGWFGGYGVEGTLGYFASIGVPVVLGWLVILGEFFGGLGLIAGLGGRIAGAGVAAILTGAAVLGGHIANGFFMNWGGTAPGEGWEFFLLAVAMGVTVAVRGSGAWSLDRLIVRSAPLECMPGRAGQVRKAA